MNTYITKAKIAAKQINEAMNRDIDMSEVERIALTSLAVVGITIERTDDFFHSINRADLTEQMVYNAILRHRKPEINVSTCCGVKAAPIGDVDTETLRICPRCKERCEYESIAI